MVLANNFLREEKWAREEMTNNLKLIVPAFVSIF